MAYLSLGSLMGPSPRRFMVIVWSAPRLAITQIMSNFPRYKKRLTKRRQCLMFLHEPRLAQFKVWFQTIQTNNRELEFRDNMYSFLGNKNTSRTSTDKVKKYTPNALRSEY